MPEDIAAHLQDPDVRVAISLVIVILLIIVMNSANFKKSIIVLMAAVTYLASGSCLAKFVDEPFKPLGSVESFNSALLQRPTYGKIPQPKTIADKVIVETQPYVYGHPFFQRLDPDVKKGKRLPADEEYLEQRKLQDQAGLLISGNDPTTPMGPIDADGVKDEFNSQTPIFIKQQRAGNGGYYKSGKYGTTQPPTLQELLQKSTQLGTVPRARKENRSVENKPKSETKVAPTVSAAPLKEDWTEFPSLQDSNFDPSHASETAPKYYFNDDNHQPVISSGRPIQSVAASAAPRGKNKPNPPAPWRAGNMTEQSSLIQLYDDYTDYKKLPNAKVETLDSGGKVMTPMPNVDYEINPHLSSMPDNSPVKLSMAHNHAARIKHSVYGRHSLNNTIVRDALSFRTPAPWAPG